MKIFVSSTHAHSSAGKMFENVRKRLRPAHTITHTRSQPMISSNSIGLVFFASQCCARLLMGSTSVPVAIKKDCNDDRCCINDSYHLFDKMIIMIIYDMMIIHDHGLDDVDDVDNVDDEGMVLCAGYGGQWNEGSAFSNPDQLTLTYCL